MNQLDIKRRGTGVRAATPLSTRWLACARPNPQAQLRLFCFPYAGGGTLSFRGWNTKLPDNIEIFLAQLPGRESRLHDPLFNSLTALVEAAEPELLPYFDKPFAFFGHSMGALISFELATALRRKHGIEPTHLFVSGCRAPQIKRAKPPTYNLTEPEFIEELIRLNGTPREVLEDPELMRLMMPILRADFEVSETYTGDEKSPLNCPISAFGGLHDPEVERKHLKAWCEQTTAPFSLQMFPGDHFFLHTAQSDLLRAVSHQLLRLEKR
jgi:medium-chain acyl-[acyl-carrier-protein] hydrolase